METKRCSKCGEWKGIEKFYPRKNYGTSDLKKVRSMCKICDKKSVAEWQKTHRNIKNLRRREWAKRNLSKSREMGGRWAKKNPGKALKRYKLWYKENINRAREIANKSAKKQHAVLTNCIVREYLKHCNVSSNIITSEMVELKREQILLFRNLKQLKEVYYEPDDSNSQRIESKNAASY